MDKFNSEGYADLTAYEALMKIEQEERAARKAANFRPLVPPACIYLQSVQRKYGV